MPPFLISFSNAEKMFEAKLANASTLKKIIDAIKDLLTDAIWDCTNEGLSLQLAKIPKLFSAMDSSHVSLVSVNLEADSFQSYRCDRNFTLGLNLVNMAKIMKGAANDDSVTLKAREEGDTISIIFESPTQERQCEYEMKLMDLEGDHLGIPDTEYACVIQMPSSEFTRICRDMSQVGDSLQITCTKNGVKFAAKGDLGSGAVRLSQTANRDDENQAVIIDLREPCIATFAIKYLMTFTKGAPLSSQTKISISNDVPIAVEYTIRDMGFVRYFLAPKIDENAPPGAANGD